MFASPDTKKECEILFESAMQFERSGAEDILHTDPALAAVLNAIMIQSHVLLVPIEAMQVAKPRTAAVILSQPKRLTVGLCLWLWLCLWLHDLPEPSGRELPSTHHVPHTGG